MKKLLITLVAVLFLTGCIPSIEDQDKVVQEDDENKGETVIVPKYQISDSYYRTLAPFEPSETRGRVLYNMNTRYESDEFEEGLLRIAQRTFSTDTYIFQDGQYVNKDTVEKWLSRKMTDKQLKAKDLSEADNLGLNPPLKDKAGKEDMEKNPIYLAYILEHNFLLNTEDKKVKLGGVSIGLALNSVYYYTFEGTPYEKKISDETIEKEGKRIAEEVIGRLRALEVNGSKPLENVPITIGLYKQGEQTSVVPGSYFAFATSKKGTSLEWDVINEEFILFPSAEASKKYRDDADAFEQFKLKVMDYFPNYNSIVGRGFYIDNELQKLTIDITMQFYGKAETIGFSQYIAGLIVQYFPDHIITEVRIQSNNDQEALILKEPGMEEPFVHIY